MTKAIEFTCSISPCLACSFCPQPKLAVAYTSGKRKLTMEDFELMLSKVPKDVIVHFSGFSECFLNPLAPQMIHKAKVAGYTVNIFTTLMGLTGAGAAHLPQTIDFVRIHVPDEKALTIPDDKWIGQHMIFLKTGISATYMAMGELTPNVSKWMDDLGIAVEMPTMLSRAGNLDWVADGRPIKGNLTCEAARYWTHVALPDGRIVGCSMLYSLEIVLGNLLTQTYEEIEVEADKWAADKNPPEDSPCRKCCWAKPI